MTNEALPAPLALHLDAVARAIRHSTAATAPTLVHDVIAEFACLTDLVEMTTDLSAAINSVIRDVKALAEDLRRPGAKPDSLPVRQALDVSLAALKLQLACSEPSEEAVAQNISW